jgi:arginine exporter protein ArgO
VLLLVAARGFSGARRWTQTSAEPPTRTPHSAVYLRFVGLTLINPLTVIYFSSIVLANQAVAGGAQAVAFVGGVALASASWQALLAISGALVGRAFVYRGHLATAVLGYGVVLAIAVDQLSQV